MKNDLEEWTWEEPLSNHRVEMRSANMGMHALQSIYDTIKTLPNNFKRQRQFAIANCREMKKVLTSLNEKNQLYLSTIANLSAQRQRLQEQLDRASNGGNFYTAE